jgi:hypothetical protein
LRSAWNNILEAIPVLDLEKAKHELRDAIKKAQYPGRFQIRITADATQDYLEVRLLKVPETAAEVLINWVNELVSTIRLDVPVIVRA